jgi:ubiquinone/menaquinone biosynthesis C-methylase UbiE
MKDSNMKSTDTIRRRYNRISFYYNIMEWPMECLRFAAWRKRLCNKLSGPSILEAGVGTGKNIPYYPEGASVTAIDFSPHMLARARIAARHLHRKVEFLEMDIQRLDLQSHAFDTVFATFVFCSVPDPVKGLAELRRVCKPDGRLLLLEHVRPGNYLLGKLFDALNPLTVRATGANINRRTIKNIVKAGWRIQMLQPLALDIVQSVEAVP